MPYYPTSAPGAQFSGNMLRPTGPMPAQAQQGAQLGNPMPSQAPGMQMGGQPAAGVPGVPQGGFQRMQPMAQGGGGQMSPIAMQALAALMHPATPLNVKANLLSVLGIR